MTPIARDVPDAYVGDVGFVSQNTPWFAAVDAIVAEAIDVEIELVAREVLSNRDYSAGRLAALRDLRTNLYVVLQVVEESA